MAPSAQRALATAWASHHSFSLIFGFPTAVGYVVLLTVCKSLTDPYKMSDSPQANDPQSKGGLAGKSGVKNPSRKRRNGGKKPAKKLEWSDVSREASW